MAQERVRKLSIHKLIPNMITLSAMSAGITAIKFAIDGRWEASVLAIVAATFLDAFDGAAARLLKASSKIGAELDSLSDFAAFGIAPAVVTFLWATKHIGRWGWFISLVYVIALGLRLARFNVQKGDEDTSEEESKNPLNRYFTGIPSPVAAGLCILPLICHFLSQDYPFPYQEYLLMPWTVGIWTLFIAGMAVSQIPTFSSKQIRIPYRLRVIALGGFGLMIAGLINDPWPTLTLMGIVYLSMLPFGYLHFLRTRRAWLAGETPCEDMEDDH